jgi:ribose 5-phosphate isomerase B
MKLSVGSDERSHIVDFTLEYLADNGHSHTYYGPEDEDSVPWPEVARRVAEDVIADRSDEGILFCWTGTGVSLAANKVRGIRAALCADAETARGARLWNNANVLCLSNRLISTAVAKEILEQWFETAYKPNPEDDACLAMIKSLEEVPPLG